MPHRKHACAAAVLAALLLTAGCGYIGSPLVPLANVPSRITDLATVQRGATIIVHLSVPTMTTENNPIKTAVKLDLRIGAAADRFNPDEWARQAKSISDPQIKDGIATYKIPTQEWSGKKIVIGVRAIGSNGKQATWSNFETLSVVTPPEVPSRPELTDTPAGERIAWTGRGDRFRVLRRVGDEETYAVVATVAGHEWTDTAIEYGKAYTYMMQSLVDAGNQKTAESDLSEICKGCPVTLVDHFPPAVPSGLRADAAGDSVALVWEPDTEADLAGYRLYRELGDGPWLKLAEVNAVPSYSDAAVEHGKTYRYAVTAFDKAGNESDRSAVVVIVP